jgi:CBS domain-containing protein
MRAADDPLMPRDLHASDVMTGWVATIAAEATVKDAAKLMIERRVSALPVVGAGARVVGIVSEGDLIRRSEIGTGARREPWLHRLLHGGAREYLKTRGATVRDVMSAPVISVGPATPLAELAALLDKHRIKRVPVLDGARLAGIVSRVDLVRQLATAPARPGARTPRDRELRREVLGAAQRSGAAGLNLNATVEHGVVHLWGDVRSRGEQKALRKAAGTVGGVRKVEDHTSVIPLRVGSALRLF